MKKNPKTKPVNLVKQLQELQQVIKIHKLQATYLQAVFNSKHHYSKLQIMHAAHTIQVDVFTSTWPAFQIFLQELAIQEMNQVHNLEKKLNDLIESKFPDPGSAGRIKARDFKRSKARPGK